MISHTRRRSRTRGQALAEFALAAPIFFLLLFAIIEAGRFILYYEGLNNAARAGVRYAIIHGGNSTCPSGSMASPFPACYDPDGGNIRQAVSDAAFSLADVGDMTFPDLRATCDGYPDLGDSPDVAGLCWRDDPNGGSNSRGTPVDLIVEFTHQPLMPLIPPISIRAEANGVINN
jgi:hypothetical protein